MCVTVFGSQMFSFSLTNTSASQQPLHDIAEHWHKGHVYTAFYRVTDVLHSNADVVCSASQPYRHKRIHSSARNTWEPNGLLLALGERRDAQEAGEADLEGRLSPGLTLFPGLFGWAAAAGWKKSAGRCKTGEVSRAPPLQLPPSSSVKWRLQFNPAVALTLILLSLCKSASLSASFIVETGVEITTEAVVNTCSLSLDRFSLFLYDFLSLFPS